MRTTGKHWGCRMRGAALWSVALAVLVAVFSLYRRPEFMAQLANQLWTCF